MTTHELEIPTHNQDTKATEPVATVGPILRAAREKCGLTVDDIALQLHLRPSLVEKLEADKFDSVASATYARGYVRSFARLVGADEELVMSCLEHQVPSVAEPEMQSFSKKTSIKARDGRLMIITYVIAFILIALMVIWWAQKSSSDQLDVSQPSQEEIAASNQPASITNIQPVDKLTPNSNITATDIKSSGLVINDASSKDSVVQNSSSTKAVIEIKRQTTAPKEVAQVATQPVTTETEVKAPVETQATSLQQDVAGDIANFAIKLSGDSWLKVDDASGNTLIHGVKKGGQSISVKGVEPINFVIGAPQVVKLEYNGQNINLDKYPSGRAVRFSLPRT